MDSEEIALRNATYRWFVESGGAPTPAQLATAMGRSPEAVEAGWRRLHDAHALVLDADGAIRMLNPFSAVPTPFTVEGAGRTWFANCGWDAFGIGAALHVDSVIETRCGDCGDQIRIEVRDGRPSDPDLLWHVLIPARSWWQDIGFT